MFCRGFATPQCGNRRGRAFPSAVVRGRARVAAGPGMFAPAFDPGARDARDGFASRPGVAWTTEESDCRMCGISRFRLVRGGKDKARRRFALARRGLRDPTRYDASSPTLWPTNAASIPFFRAPRAV